MWMLSRSLIQRPLQYMAGLTLGSLLLVGSPAQAQQRPSLAQLQQQLDALQQQVTAQQTTITNLTNRLGVVEANPVLDLGPYVSVELSPLNGLPGPHILWTGANLHVRSGSDATDGVLTGLGNLVVGYNEGSSGSGSHNIVVGSGHTFSSFGGIVAGFDNSRSASAHAASSPTGVERGFLVYSRLCAGSCAASTGRPRATHQPSQTSHDALRYHAQNAVPGPTTAIAALARRGTGA